MVKSLTLVYVCLLVLFFLYNAVFFNLFNVKNSSTKSKTQDNVYKGSDSSRSPLIEGRLVVILIDAMRYDFIFESHLKDIRMPFVNRLIREKKAVPFKLSASPPTVTLPRLKALMSGIIPEFIDILWNFNTTYLTEDNLLKKFRQANKSIIFYGDDTWLKLFNPTEYFIRYEGTTSFIASDYDEVDLNVTRHLSFELNQNDWHLMILHYLGLDHVGHIEGPFAPLNIKRKLHEMDEIIKKIYSSVNENDLILILSDHGMANEGGHGGSSHMEITTPILFVSKKLFTSEYVHMNDDDFLKLINGIKHRSQIDLVSTISCLFNLDVPRDNKGVMFLGDLLDYLEDTSKANSIGIGCLRQNFEQLKNLFDQKNDIEFKEINQNYSLNHLEDLVREKFESKIKSERTNKDQNLYLMLIIVLMFMILGFNFVKMWDLSLCNLKEIIKIDGLKMFFIFSFGMHVLSLFSSSFIEEEHQIWYFIGTTQLYLVLYVSIQKRVFTKKNCIFYFLGLFLAFRLMRSVNQTGNKWIHIKDLGDFLKENPSKVPLIIFTILSLGLIYKVTKIKIRTMTALILMLVFAFHFSTCFELLNLYNRNLIAQICYLSIGSNLIMQLFTLSRNKNFMQLLEILINNWTYFNCLVQPSHNLIVISLWRLIDVLIDTIFEKTRTKIFTNPHNLLSFFQIICFFSYFTQGNSNSLNTIQISSGLVGINQLNEALVGLLLITSTYSSYIFWSLCMIKNLIFYELERVKNMTINNKEALKSLMVIQINFWFSFDLIVLTIYSFNSFIQKEHLFVWSVFAPKLIYLLGSVLIRLTSVIFYNFIFTVLF